MKLSYDEYVPKTENVDLSPIVLLHSIMETKKTWKLLGEPLSNRTGRKVYALDARHHGESLWMGDYNVDVMVDDLEEFLTHHSISRVVLVGHSLGGKVAISFAFRQPHRVESIVVEDVPVRNFKHRLHNLVPLAAKLIKSIGEDFKSINDRSEANEHIKFLGHNLVDHFKIKLEVVDGYDVDMLPLRWNGDFYELDLNIDAIVDAIHSDNLRQNLDLSGKFPGDALFIFGGDSQYKGHKDSLVEEFFPNSRRIIVEGTGHFIHQSCPEKFLTEVVSFVNENNSLRSKY